MGGRFKQRGGGRGRNNKDPLAMLERCHRKLEVRLLELASAAAAMRRGERGAADAVADVVAFLDTSIARHERDEEESVFPRLRERASGTGLEALSALLVDLAAEHHRHEALHQTLRELSGGDASPATGARIGALCEELRVLYGRHINREEAELFPAMRSLLSADDVAAIGREMQARRGR